MNSRQYLSLVLAAGAAAATVPLLHAAPTMQPGPTMQPTGGGGNVAGQRKAVSDAQAECARIRADMNAIRTKTETTFATKDDWIAAKKAYDQAKANYDAAARPVLDKLKKKPEYQKAVADQLKAQAVLDSAKNGKQPAGESAEASADEDKPPGDIYKDAAALQLSAGLEQRRLKTEALSEDPKVVAAAAIRDEAKKTWDALQLQVTDAVSSDPEYIADQKQLELADGRLAQARTQLASSEKAAREQAEARRKQEAAAKQQQSGTGMTGSGYRR